MSNDRCATVKTRLHRIKGFSPPFSILQNHVEWEGRLKQWVDFVDRTRKNFVLTERSAICSEHFTPESFNIRYPLPGHERRLLRDKIGIISTIYKVLIWSTKLPNGEKSTELLICFTLTLLTDFFLQILKETLTEPSTSAVGEFNEPSCSTFSEPDNCDRDEPQDHTICTSHQDLTEDFPESVPCSCVEK